MKHSIRFLILSSAFSLLGLISPQNLYAQTQDVSLTTVSAVVANNVTCTGSAQTFKTSDKIPNFRNIGQTSHLATASSLAPTFIMEIDGIDTLGNVARLSDIQIGIPTSAQGGIALTASGYMSNIQIKVTCTLGSTFSVSYSGSFSPAPANLAASLLGAVDKLPFQTAAANATTSTTFQTPTGNSSGTIIFQFAATGPSGSSVSAQCLSNSGVDLSLYTFPVLTTTGPQLFNVTAGTCPFVTLTYTSGGASATTYNLEYVFNQQGTVNGIADPCLSASALKQSAPIAFAAAATTQIVPLTAGQTIYPCGLQLTANADSSSIETFQWIYGAGSNCGTGTTVLSGPMKQNATNANNSYGFSGGTFLSIPTGNALCLAVVQIGGAVINLNGVLSYVKQ